MNPLPDEFQRHAREIGAVRSTSRARSRCRIFSSSDCCLDGGGYLEGELLNGDAAAVTAKLRAGPRSARRGRHAGAGRRGDGPLRLGRAHARWHRPPARRPRSGRSATGSTRVLTHKLAGTLIFVVVMALLFSSIFIWAEPLMGLVDAAVGSVGGFRRGVAAEGALRSLVVDGVIGGVGAVLVFLPQILILFFFIALLEDCGYMARAAFLMDRLMAGVGLSGKSFIPLLSSFACAIPGIMATRMIENRRDRLATILVAPLMSCSARLPVYVILIGAFVPAAAITWAASSGCRGSTLLAMYSVGVVVAIGVAWVLEADDLARRDAAVCDGAAELQDAVAAECALPHGRARLVVRRAGRHGDLRGDDRRLGAGLLSASRSNGRRRNCGPAGETDRVGRHPCRTRRVRRIRRISNGSATVCISRTAISAGPASGSSRPCGRWVGTGGSAVRRSRRSRPARS